MNLITVLLGVFCIGYGIYTAIMRNKSPENFGKLDAMRKKFGDKTGNIIHIVFYTFLPILAGLIFLLSGFLGIRFF